MQHIQEPQDVLGFTINVEGAQPRAASSEEGRDFVCVFMHDPISSGVHFEAYIDKCGIRAFHENFSPTHSQIFHIDRGPEDVMVQCCCAPVAADMSDIDPSSACEAWSKSRV